MEYKIYNPKIIETILNSPEKISIFVNNFNLIISNDIENEMIGKCMFNNIKNWYYGESNTIRIFGR
jgi:hypothetical protein